MRETATFTPGPKLTEHVDELVGVERLERRGRRRDGHGGVASRGERHVADRDEDPVMLLTVA
jgi:hypothetical protein